MDFTTLATPEALGRAVTHLTGNGFLPEEVASKAAALDRIKALIPAGASIMNGSSVTLEEIGFVDYLKGGQHPWNNLHTKILAEPDRAKQGLLRKQSVVSDFYLGSVNALTATGEMMIASNTGSQLAPLAYTSTNLILVIGTQKIVPDIATGFARLKEYTMPFEDARLKKLTGGIGTLHAKTLILQRENPRLGRQVHVLLIKEKLGF